MKRKIRRDSEIISMMADEVVSLLRAALLASKIEDRRWLRSVLQDLSDAQDDLSEAARRWSRGIPIVRNPIDAPESPGEFISVAKDLVKVAEIYKDQHEIFRRRVGQKEADIWLRKWKKAEHAARDAVLTAYREHVSHGWHWPSRLDTTFAAYLR